MITKIKDKSDNSKYKNIASLGWGNNLVAIRWNHLFNTKLFCNNTISYSQYKYKTGLENIENIGQYEESIFNGFTSNKRFINKI